MAVYNILPTTNLKWDDIRDTLNAGGGTVTNVVSTAFMTTSNIDIWAKYKPVGYTSNFPDYNSDWYKGNDKMCGIGIPNINGDPSSIKDAPWYYNPPKGGQSEPYRLGDYRGYNRNATFFITGWWKRQTIQLNKGGDATLRVNCAVLRPTQTNNLQVEDVELLSNIRLGLKITGGGRSWIKTSAKTAKEVVNDSGILQCTVNFDTEIPFVSDSGVYTVTQFLTTSDYSALGTFPTIIQCYSVPNYYEGDYVNEQNVKYVSVADGFEILAEGLSNSLTGTYHDEDYHMVNPFQVKTGSYEYWKCKLTNRSTTESLTFDLTDLVYHSVNVQGDDVSDDASSSETEIKLYNSSFSELSTKRITVAKNSSVYIYIRTRLFSKNALISSGMNAVSALTYAYYSDPNLNIVNRISCRFECMIQGSR